ncbi:MAG: serine protease [Betaproteobacteria bacterium]|nr:MAG: serine protease [Betaproteobacteria bacterium]
MASQWKRRVGTVCRKVRAASFDACPNGQAHLSDRAGCAATPACTMASSYHPAVCIMNTPSSPPDLPDSVERLAASVVGIATRRHGSSGVLWRNGVVVGNASALWRASSVSLVLPDGEQVQGELRGIDGGTDLACVTFASGAMPVAERAAAAAPRVGDFVFAVGRKPSGLTQASFGHVGAAAGEWRTWRGGRVDRLIQLDGGLYPGFEGAPVADASGQVLGIASPSFSRHHGVVLPVATVDRVLEQLLAHGRVQQGYLGIAAQPVRATLDGSAVDGLLVSSLASDGPAARAGLQVGDVIVKVGGEPVASLHELRELLQVGSQVRVLVSRGGQGHELSLEVVERPRSHCH